MDLPKSFIRNNELKEDVILTLLITWIAIWRKKNEKVFQGKYPNLHRCITFLKNSFTKSKYRRNTKKIYNRIDPILKYWCIKPLSNFNKFNVDATYLDDSNSFVVIACKRTF